METGNGIKLETEIETQSLSFCTPSKMHMLLAFIAEHPRALSTYWVFDYTPASLAGLCRPQYFCIEHIIFFYHPILFCRNLIFFL